MKVLVIGGAGYIGSHVAKALMKSGHRVRVFDNLSSGQEINLFKQNEFVKGDILDYPALLSAMQGQEAVIHLAAKKAVGESMENPMIYSSNNISGSLNILNAMVETGAKYIVFSSSAAVYGMPEKIPVDETAPLNPINYYGSMPSAMMPKAISAVRNAVRKICFRLSWKLFPANVKNLKSSVMIIPPRTEPAFAIIFM